jgi:hypothetical protein
VDSIHWQLSPLFRNFVEVPKDTSAMKNMEKDRQKPRKKDRREMIQYINLQLAALGQPQFTDET